MKTPVTIAIGIFVFFNIAATQADAGLINSTVDVTVYFPNLATVLDKPGSEVVQDPGVEYPLGKFTQSGASGISVDVQDNSITITNTAPFNPNVAFDGLILTILSGPDGSTAPTFTGFSIQSSSSIFPSPIVTLNGNQLIINYSVPLQQGQTASGGTTTITFTTSSPDVGPAAVPEPATVTLFGIAAAGGAFYGWRRRQQAA